MMMPQCSFLFIISSILFAAAGGDFPTGAIHGVRCILLKNEPFDCDSVAEVKVPSYLVQAYNDAPKTLQDALRDGHLTRLSNDDIGRIPPSLVYLIPRERLAELNTTQLAAVVQSHSDDTGIAQQVVASLQSPHLLPFLLKLRINDLTQDVLEVIAGSVDSASLSSEMFYRSLTREEDPVMANLRPSMLLNEETFFKVASYLKSIGTESPDVLKKETKHVLTEGAARAKFNLNQFSWLASGLTPDNILRESTNIDVHSFKLNLTRLQARAVFDRVYKNGMPEMIDSLHQMINLSPRQLQRYPVKARTYDTLNMMPTTISLPTACQIKVYVTEDCERTGKLPKRGSEPWGPRVRYLRQWVYTLPLSALADYLQQPLSTSNLQLITSPALSPMQAYYLTGRGSVLNVMAPNSIQDLGTMLHALPASQLVTRMVGDVSSPMMGHLAGHLPADNWPRTLALVHKIASSIDERFVLDNLLENKDVGAIMGMVTVNDLQAGAREMLDLMQENGLLPKAHRLPPQVLAFLLETKRTSEDWSWQSMLDESQPSHYLVGGLTCQQIEQMDTGLFIPIMAQYNRQRTQTFPKNLQYCSLQKLIRHLMLKMSLSQTEPHHGLISMLEPVEIESIGGYILVGLPLDAMEFSPYLNLILEKVGRLSNAELMQAANITQLQQIASLTVNEDNIIDVFTARNLIWWAPPSASIPELKLSLEAGILDTTLCLPADIRGHIAVKLQDIFGSPETWSPGVLSTLNDLLVVFSEDELNKVSLKSWTEAADSFSSGYGKEVAWTQKFDLFYQVCAGILGTIEEDEYESAVSQMVRKQMIGAQLLLNTVVDQPIQTLHPIDFNKNDLEQGSDSIDDIPVDETDDDEEDVPSTEEVENENEMDHVPVDVTTEKTVTTTEKPILNKITTEHAKTNKSVFFNIQSKVDKNIPEGEYTPRRDKEQSNKEPATNRPSVTKHTTTTDSSLNNSKLNNTVPSSVPTNDGDLTEHGSKVNNENNTSTNPTKIYANSDEEEDNKINEKKYTSEKDTHSLNGEKVMNEENNNVDHKVNTSGKEFDHSYENESTQESNEGSEETHDTNSGQTSPNSEESEDIHKSIANKNETVPKLTPSKSTAHHNVSTSDKNTDADTEYDTDTGSILDEYDENDEPEENNTTILQSNPTRHLPSSSSFDSKNKRNKRDLQDDKVMLTCNALRMVGRLAGLALTERDVKEMSADELDECRVELGAMVLSESLQKIIWNRISNQLNGIHLLGNLLNVVPASYLWDLKFNVSEPWALESIYAFFKFSKSDYMQDKTMEKVLTENSDLTAELLAVMGPALCSLEKSQLHGLSVLELEAFHQCPAPACLSHLAQLAVKQLSEPLLWTRHHVHALHAIVAGLSVEDWLALASSPDKPLSGLHPAAVPCLNNTHLEILSPEVIQLIPTTSLLALSEQQLAVLNSSQSAVIANITQLAVQEVLTPSELTVSPSLAISTFAGFHQSVILLSICISVFQMFH